jgi:hypothetical protein
VTKTCIPKTIAEIRDYFNDGGKVADLLSIPERLVPLTKKAKEIGIDLELALILLKCDDEEGLWPIPLYRIYYLPGGETVTEPVIFNGPDELINLPLGKIEQGKLM